MAAKESHDNSPKRKGELPTIRWYAMRFAYLFTAAVVGFSAWPELINQGRMISPGKPSDLIHGVAFRFYAAYPVLFLFGVRFPLKMPPLALQQLFYKTVWLVGVAYPLWSAGRVNPEVRGVFRFFPSIVILDLMDPRGVGV